MVSDVGDVRIGGTGTREGNLIIKNKEDGVTITESGATGNHIINNNIGTDGVLDLGNEGQGISIVNGAKKNFVGNGDLALANVISGNEENGIFIEQSDDNRING